VNGQNREAGSSLERAMPIRGLHVSVGRRADSLQPTQGYEFRPRMASASRGRFDTIRWEPASVPGGDWWLRMWFPSVTRESNPMRILGSLFAWWMDHAGRARPSLVRGRRAPACESLEGRRLLSAGVGGSAWTSWGDPGGAASGGSRPAEVHLLDATG